MGGESRKGWGYGEPDANAWRLIVGRVRGWGLVFWVPLLLAVYVC